MSFDRFPHLAQRLFNVPIAIRPEKAEIIMAALADRLGVARIFRIDGSMRAFDDEGGMLVLADGPRERNAGYDVIAGVAIIPVEGTLVHKLGTLRPWSGMTGYDGIRMNFGAALEDDDVKAIVLDIDSPGGEVHGCFDLADAVYGARGRKPIWAILDESAFSAGYALACAADRVIVPRTGGTGSVGVWGMHVDLSRALDKDGITVTLIQFGAHKTEGNAYEPLSKAALGRLQSWIDKQGEIFVETVARNRGLTPAKVRATEADCFFGADGVRAGFADDVMPPDEAFRSLLAELA